MKLRYDPETDSLNVDLNAEGEVVGFDIDHASTRTSVRLASSLRCGRAPIPTLADTDPS
jgi:uncharacterized protein YuzE